MSRKQAADLLFTVVILALVVLAVWDARQWEIKARLFPWVIGFPLAGLLAVQAVMTVVRRPKEGAHHADELGLEGIDPVLLRKRAISITSWLIGFALVIWLLGFPIGGTLGTLAYLRFTGKEQWRMSLAIAAGTAAFFWVMANPLTVPFPRGYLFELLGIPL